MVTRFTFAVPGDLATPTGGYAYDRRMIAELGSLGWQADYLDLGFGFPWPDAARRARAETLLDAVADGTVIVIDGLALGVLPEAAMRLKDRCRLVALVHHPLAMESGIGADAAKILHDSERRALSAARHVIAVSAATARALAQDYDVLPSRIAIASPGTDRPALNARQPASGGAVKLLSVGAVVPRKGFDVLVSALAALTDLPWTLAIVGDRSRDPAYAEALDRVIERHRLGDRVTVTGAVSAERLAEYYTQADVFALASYFEGFGMAYAEAVAYGLPVVGTTGGAIPDTVPAAAALLVAPGDIAALTAALRDVIASPAIRARLADAARAAADNLPTWPGSARIIAGVLEACA